MSATKSKSSLAAKPVPPSSTEKSITPPFTGESRMLFAAHSSLPAIPQVPLRLLVEYEGMSWNPISSPPVTVLPVPAPRQHSPVRACSSSAYSCACSLSVPSSTLLSRTSSPRVRASRRPERPPEPAPPERPPEPSPPERLPEGNVPHARTWFHLSLYWAHLHVIQTSSPPLLKRIPHSTALYDLVCLFEALIRSELLTISTNYLLLTSLWTYFQYSLQRVFPSLSAPVFCSRIHLCEVCVLLIVPRIPVKTRISNFSLIAPQTGLSKYILTVSSQLCSTIL